MADVTTLCTMVNSRFSAWIETAIVAYDELTVIVKPDYLLNICETLRDQSEFKFETLIDITGIDYLHYGYSDWQTESATASGFSRGATHRWMMEQNKISSSP